jgi:hypothetical protein
MPDALLKYGVATDTSTAGSLHVERQIRKAGSADFAVSADWTPVAGDVTVKKDLGAAANIGTLPTYTNGAWRFVFTAAELQCRRLHVKIVDSATKAVDDDFFSVWTYGGDSAEYPTDYGDGVRLGLTALPNAAAGAAGGLGDMVRISGSTVAADNLEAYYTKRLFIVHDGNSTASGATLQAAIQGASAGTLVEFADGDYDMTASLTVPGRVTVRGTSRASRMVFTNGDSGIPDIIPGDYSSFEEYTNPVNTDDDNRLTIVAGDDYSAGSGRIPSHGHRTVTNYSGPALSGTGKLRFLRGHRFVREAGHGRHGRGGDRHDGQRPTAPR